MLFSKLFQRPVVGNTLARSLIFFTTKKYHTQFVQGIKTLIKHLQSSINTLWKALDLMNTFVVNMRSFGRVIVVKNYQIFRLPEKFDKHLLFGDFPEMVSLSHFEMGETLRVHEQDLLSREMGLQTV